MNNERLTEELKKRGIPFAIEGEGLTPEKQKRQEEVESGVWEYLTRIDEAEESVSYSTLCFGESWAPNRFRRPID